MADIFIFGDSITWGFYDVDGGWAERLKKDCYPKHIIYNLGVSGNTTFDLLNRFEFETEQRFYRDEKTLVIFSIGINDSQFNNKENRTRVDVFNFRNNLLRLINKARKFTPYVIFLGLNPVDESKVDPIPWRQEFSYKNEKIKEYEGIIKNVCEETKIHFVPVFHKFYESDYENLLEDGIHPNSEGHKKIFGIIKEFLESENLLE